MQTAEDPPLPSEHCKEMQPVLQRSRLSCLCNLFSLSDMYFSFERSSDSSSGPKTCPTRIHFHDDHYQSQQNTHFYPLRFFFGQKGLDRRRLCSTRPRTKRSDLQSGKIMWTFWLQTKFYFSSAMQLQASHVNVWAAVAMADRRGHRECACISPLALCHTWRLAPFTDRHISGLRVPCVLCLNWAQGLSPIHDQLVIKKERQCNYTLLYRYVFFTPNSI